MNKCKRILTILLTTCVIQTICNAQSRILDFVDPMIGTTNFSVCNPGAVMPHGLMSVVPFNVMGSDLNNYDKDARWWSAPYEKTNSFFTGFAHVTMSGVGCPEMGTLLTMATDTLDVDYHNYGSTYSNETASPGYYSVNIDKYDVRAETTVSMRSSIERYTFRKGGDKYIFLNLGEGLTNETGAMIRRVNDTEIEGFRLLGTFCYNSQAVFPIYFVMRVSKQPANSGYWKKQPLKHGVEAQWDKDHGKYKLYTNYGKELAGNDIGYYFAFNCYDNEVIEVKMGVSFVSMDNARRNLDAEVNDLTFENIKEKAEKQWEKTLSAVAVEGGNDDYKKIFYTALYHTQIHPTIIQDVNGEYPLMESYGIGKTQRNRYTIFSLWDTYRNLHQLQTLLYPEEQLDMVRSMIDMQKEWGWMPKWELFGRETWTMEGDPSIPVITDTYLKGLRNFDINTAYKAFVHSATTDGKNNKMRPDIDKYITRGYIPLGEYAQDESGDNSVSHALEYYIADAALAKLADALGKKDDAKRFREQSLKYKHYYSKESGTLRPIRQDGSFLTPFNPDDGANFSNAPGFHEGSAWNYTFYVPHDVYGLARLMGGKKKFIEKLQYVFDNNLYDPANEPDIAYPFLFSYFNGEEWRTQKEVRRLIDTYYKPTPDGIPGNDDCGTMSAWVVFSMIGLYPDCPGDPSYTLTSPVFDKITLHLDPKYYPEGNVIIETLRDDYDDCVIKNIELNGKQYNKYRILHKDLIKNKHIKFTLNKSIR